MRPQNFQRQPRRNASLPWTSTSRASRLHGDTCGTYCTARRWLSAMWATSLREALCILLLVTLASLTLTFHLGHHLHPLQVWLDPDARPKEPGKENHSDVYHSPRLSALFSSSKQADGQGTSRPPAKEKSAYGGVRQVMQGKSRASSGNTSGSPAQFQEVLQVLQQEGGAHSVTSQTQTHKIADHVTQPDTETSISSEVTEITAPILPPFVGLPLCVAFQRGSSGDFELCKERNQREVADGAADGGRLRVMLAGTRKELRRDAALLQSALKKHSAQVTHRILGDAESEMPRISDKALQQDDGWSILLCLNTTHSDDCVVTATRNGPTTSQQKINVIPGLKEVLGQPQTFCRHKGADRQGRWLNADLTCAELADITRSTNNDEIAWDSVCEWHPLLLWASRSTAAVQMSICSDIERKEREGVALELPTNFLFLEDLDSLTAPSSDGLFPGHKVSQATEGHSPRRTTASDWRNALTWRFPVLVTSLSPLRAYMHLEGVAWDGLTSYLAQKPQRDLSLLELQRIAADRHGDEVAAATVSYLEATIMDTLIQLEELVHPPADRRCPRCFEVLEVTAVFNTTFHPFVLQVGASSLSAHLSSLSEYLVRQVMINDLLTILNERRNVSLDLARALVDLGLSNVVQDSVCNADRRFCLGPREQTYLLDGLREHLVKTGWKRVYPSTSAVRFTGLVQEGSRHLSSPASPDSTSLSWTPRQPVLRSSHLHSLLLSLETFFQRAGDSGQMDSFEDLSMPVDQSHGRPNGSEEISVQRILTENVSDGMTGPPCSEEPSRMPYLSSVVTRPVLTLRPEFSPLRTDYEAVVEHNVQLVTVWAWSQSCQSQARLENKYNTNRSANFTLGLGLNVLRVMVVDTTHEEPWVVNTYSLVVRRLEADHGLGPLRPDVRHVVCRLKQDCSLPYAPRETCGLHPVSSMTSWSQFLSRQGGLPVCSSGHEPGEWYVPCSSCRDDSAQCYWKEAVWSSKMCQEPRMPQTDLQKCFRGKKVLFIGDSTNRGILHYISQRVNGSLWEWPDKTHHLRVFPALNNNSTFFSFAYYPQFWLPTRHRPVFDKALYQLIRRSLPLANDTSTVVVVGGVHWLAKHHLNVVQTALAREGLTGAQVIVKGLGSGFHQPVSGVHQLSQAEQEKLFWHNQQILSYAKLHGIAVVDTFNITMARYSHFLQGRCTCHFHRITRKLHHRTEDYSAPTTTYNVEGDINAAYSEMVINRICKPS